MNRAQKKQRLKDLKRNAKVRKKANLRPPLEPVKEREPVPAPEPDLPAASPELRDAFMRSHGRMLAEGNVGISKYAVAGAQIALERTEDGRLTDECVHDMLESAAENLHLAQNLLNQCLNQLPQEVVRDVVEDAMAEPPKGELAESLPKRPRGRVHPVLALIRQIATVGRLLKQILSMTHPHKFTRKPAAA